MDYGMAVLKSGVKYPTKLHWKNTNQNEPRDKFRAILKFLESKQWIYVQDVLESPLCMIFYIPGCKTKVHLSFLEGLCCL